MENFFFLNRKTFTAGSDACVEETLLLTANQVNREHKCASYVHMYDCLAKIKSLGEILDYLQ